MTVGDRVTVIAERDEYYGFSGEVIEISPDGRLAVDVEIPKRYRVVFAPEELALELTPRD